MNVYDRSQQGPTIRLTRRRWPFALALLVLGLAATAWATDLLRQTPMQAPQGVSALVQGGSGDWTTPADPQPTSGDPTVNVWPLFTSGGATATQVEIGLYKQLTSSPATYRMVGRRILGTLAASASDTATIGTGTYYLGETVGTDARSATHYDVRVRGSVSAGEVCFSRHTSAASGSAPR